MSNDIEIAEKVKELKAQYYKKYREKNKDKIKRNITKYWVNKAKKELEKNQKEK